MIQRGLFLFFCAVPFMGSCADLRQKKIDEINAAIHQYEKVMIDGKPRICKRGKPLTKDELRLALDECEQLTAQLDELKSGSARAELFKGTYLEAKDDDMEWARAIERKHGCSFWAYTQIIVLSLFKNASAFAPPTDHLNPNLYHSPSQFKPYIGGPRVKLDLPMPARPRAPRRRPSMPMPKFWKKRSGKF